MAASTKKSQSILKDLETLYETFNDRRYRSTDPIQFAYRYTDPEDIELAAFIAALFAYGNVKSMCSAIEKVINFLGPHPCDKLKQLRATDLEDGLSEIYYRFFSTEDIHHLLLKTSEILRAQGSLSRCMQDCWRQSNQDIIEALCLFRNLFVDSRFCSRGLKFMFPHPKEGAAKRLHMFMRWMVRSDEVDLGLWRFIPSSALIVPLDTHVFRAARRLRLTRKKTPNLKAALEVTQALKSLCPGDPLKYDFALCHSGMRIAKNEC